MTRSPMLTESELQMLNDVFRQHSEVDSVILFGSRAKGNARKNSDIDLALVGNVGDLQAEAVALDLDELPLPYKFDVLALATLTHEQLREHIERVGLTIYQA